MKKLRKYDNSAGADYTKYPYYVLPTLMPELQVNGCAAKPTAAIAKRIVDLIRTILERIGK